MKDLDIKKMLLEKLIGEMGSSKGKSFKKKPATLVVEKHVAAVPVESVDDQEEPQVEDDEEEEEEEEPKSFADLVKKHAAKKRE